MWTSFPSRNLSIEKEINENAIEHGDIERECKATSMYHGEVGGFGLTRSINGLDVFVNDKIGTVLREESP